jgi:protein-S-isoprenylcysteine O-methyltransferase Ste14
MPTVKRSSLGRMRVRAPRSVARPQATATGIPCWWVAARDTMTCVDAPAFRIWPPVALGVPLFAGVVLTSAVGDPASIDGPAARWVGWALLIAFVLWNGWTLWVMASRGTGILPGGATSLILQSGPFGFSRNPLYVGLVALDVAIALLVPSFWALVFVPLGVVALEWGAVRPEERYLSEKFGPEYDDYRARVRRWL